MASNDLHLAGSQYERALELDPEYVIAHINRGLIYARLGKIKKAIAYLNKALQLDPDNAPRRIIIWVLFISARDAMTRPL